MVQAVQGRGAPEVGTVVNGYRFEGGNHRDRSRWTQVERVDVSGEYGPGAFRFPNGTLIRVGPRGGVEEIKGTGADGSASPDIKEFQANAAARATLMDAGQTDYRSAVVDGYEPGSRWNSLARGVEGVPLIGIPASNLMRDNVADRGRAAELQFVEGALRTSTGAGGPESETVRANRQYFPSYGEAAGVQQNKEMLRQRFRDQSVRIAGDAYIPADQFQSPSVGPTDPETDLPTYPGISTQISGMNGGQGPRQPQGDPNAPQPGDVRLTSQPLAPTDTPNSLSAQGYVYDGATDTWRRDRKEVVDGGYSPALAQERQRVEQLGRAGVGYNITDATTGPLNDEMAYGAGFIAQGIGNIGRRLSGRDIEVTAGARGRAARDVMREQQDEFARERPVQNFVGNALGAATLGPGGGAAGTPGILSRMGVGGAVGGAYGFAEARGNVLQRAPGAAIGGALGAVAVPAVERVVAPVLGRAVEPAANALASAGRFAGRQIGRAGEAAGVPGAAGLVERLQPNALQSGADKFAERLGAERVNALAPRAQGYRDNSVDPTFVDALDDGGVGIMRGLNTRQTPAREGAVRFAEGRRDNLPDRVNRIANEEIGNPNGTSRAANEGARVERRRNASEINSFGSQSVDLPENVVTALRSQNARTELMNASRRAESSLDPDIRASAPMLAALARADDAASARLTIREVQEVSRALRESGDQAFKSGNPEGPLYRDLGNAVRNAARDQSNEYRAWLTRYADDSDLLEATTTGRNFVSVSPDPMSARSTEAFVEAASTATPPVRKAMRDAASMATQTSASNPTAARSTLESMRADRGMAERASSLGLDAERLSNRAGAELSSLTAAQRASPRVGSESSTNLQDTGVAAGINLVDDIGMIARRPVTGAMSVLATRLTKQGFNDAEAQAIGQAAIDPQQTDRLISMLAQRMSRREARNLARALRYQVTTSLQSGQQN